MADIHSIAIEDNEIKWLTVRGRQVVRAISLPLESGLVKDGVVLDKVVVSQKIRQLLKTGKISAQKVIASVSGIHSVYRLLTFPRLPRELLAEAVKREAEKVMPVPTKDLYLSWQSLSVSGEETMVCLVGLPRGRVDALMDTLRQAGLDPYLMDVRPLAAAGACGEREAIAINVEKNDFDIVIAVNGVPELVRSLAFSRDDLTPLDKAEEIKEELDRTIRFYNSSHEKRPIREDMPVIMGGEAQVAEIVREGLPYPVKPLSVPLSHSGNFDAAAFMANIGLVLKEIKTDQTGLRLNLNVVPQVYLPQPVPVLPILSWIVIIVAIVLLAWLGLNTRQVIAENSVLKAELSQVQTEIKAHGVNPEDISQLETRLTEVTAARDAMKKVVAGWEQQRLKVSDDLSKAHSLLPGTVTPPVAFNYGTQTLIVEGIASDKDTILSYAKNLQASGRFSQVFIAFDTIEYRQLKFQITLK